MPYEIAIGRLGIMPDEALAFEDSVTGMRSACGAGLATIGVTSSQTAATLHASGASHTIADFNDPVVWQFLREQ